MSIRNSPSLLAWFSYSILPPHIAIGQVDTDMSTMNPPEAIVALARVDRRVSRFSRGGFLVRPLGKGAYRKRFGGLSWTSSDPLGSNSNVGQMTDVGSQSDSLTVELFPRMLALCLSHQWSKLACCRIS